MNELIYGKNPMTRIVCIEPGDDTATVFRELEDGTIATQEVPNSHWILFSEQHSEKFRRLAGNQPFRWIMEYDSRKKYEEVLRKAYQRRMDFHVCRDPKEALMIKDGYTYFKGMKVNEVSVLSFDLEHTYGIGETLAEDGQILLISNTFRKNGKITRKLFAYDEYTSQRAMLVAWVTWVLNMDPSIITGFNIIGHDFVILREAFDRAGADFALGRNGVPVEFADRTSQFRKDGSQSYDYHNVHVYGREVVDMFFVAMKYDTAARREYESYRLKEIVAHEGLERKGRQHYDASKIRENYQKPEEWTKIKKYAEDDGDDPLKLFDLMIPSFFYYTQSVPRGLQSIVNSATGSQTNSLMVRSYLQIGHSIARGSEKEEFEGAISFGVPGIHKNVFKIDVQSLYPSIILSKRIFDPKKDPNGHFLKLVETFTQERIRNKERGEATGERYFKDMSDSQKIAINSMYGFLGAPKLNYNSPKLAALVTETGREILKQAIRWATGQEYVPNLPEGEDSDDDAA